MWREVVGFSVVLWTAPIFSMDTTLMLYRPMTETSSHPIVETLSKKSGACFGQSHLIKREDAWHCIADGKDYDPCFVKRFGSQLEALCLESPWSTRGVQITVVKPLDNHLHETLDMSQTLPWAIELADGEKCLAIESMESHDGLPVRYRCDTNTVLIGHIQRCTSAWKTLKHNDQTVTTVAISRAWF